MLDSTLFADVAHAIGLSNPTIVEKDYYVVQLLKIIQSLELPHHQIVFSGGTSLAKSEINTYRMSEDVDLKLVPDDSFHSGLSNSAKKNLRKNIREEIEALIEQSDVFKLEESPTVRDEYRYMCFEIKYPQAYQQSPCLRPYIKLELTESGVLSTTVSRDISSLYATAIKEPAELTGFTCASIIDTQAEKIISMLRRTASHSRNIDRGDDEALIRHIYDTHHIQLAYPSDIETLATLVSKVMHADIERYGNQHPQMVEAPIEELYYALELLEADPLHQTRYVHYVTPMVYAEDKTAWPEAFHSFKSLVEQVFQKMDGKPN